jgi:hypothetical protein
MYCSLLVPPAMGHTFFVLIDCPISFSNFFSEGLRRMEKKLGIGEFKED